MQRRDFSQAALLSAAALVSPWANAQARVPREGTEFLKLSRPATVDAAAGKVEVVEFFWYNCPHCNQFEPMFDAWAKKQSADVVVRRVPVAFRDNFAPQQRLYYAIEAMGKVAELHTKVFHTIHVEKQRLETQEQMTDWMAKQGVDRAKFLEYYNAFAVAGKARKASQLTDGYQVDGVPALGVAGRYFTSGSLAGTMERSLQVADYLVDLARKG